MFFTKYKCLLCSAFGNEKYFKITNKLKEHGVKYQTDIIRNPNTYPPIDHNDRAHYDIYVKEEDKHKAQQAIKSIL